MLLVSHCLQPVVLFVCLSSHAYKGEHLLSIKTRGTRIKGHQDMIMVEAEHQGGQTYKPNTSTSDWDLLRIQLTCCSVQDLGLEEYAGVLVGDAGEKQPLGLNWTTRYYNLRTTWWTLLDPALMLRQLSLLLLKMIQFLFRAAMISLLINLSTNRKPFW